MSGSIETAHAFRTGHALIVYLVGPCPIIFRSEHSFRQKSGVKGLP